MRVFILNKTSTKEKWGDLSSTRGSSVISQMPIVTLNEVNLTEDCDYHHSLVYCDSCQDSENKLIKLFNAFST